MTNVTQEQEDGKLSQQQGGYPTVKRLDSGGRTCCYHDNHLSDTHYPDWWLASHVLDGDI
jgi:hypothetical protein